MADLTALNRKRGCVKSALTLFKKHVDNIVEIDKLNELQIIELQDRLNNSVSLLDDFNNVHNEIEMLCEVESLDEQASEKESFLEKFYATTSRAKFLLKQYEDTASEASSCVPKHQPLTAVKLPDISLPTFSGRFEEWLEFRDLFDNLIHQNGSLSDTQKFFYLRSSLEGSAAASIKKVKYHPSNYTLAWDTLCERFNNTKKLLHDHLGALFFFDAIQKGSYDKLQQLADNISRHLGAIEQLGQCIQNWDCLIIFWISQKLDNATLYDWERQTRNSVEPPSIDYFLNFLRDRANFVDTLDYKCGHMHDKGGNKANKEIIKNTRKETSRVLVSGQYTYTCTFCKGVHSIYTCEEFLNLSINDRNQFVKKTPSICANCLRAGHSLAKCRMGPCRKCKSRHNTLLHSDNEVRSNNNEIQDPTNSNVMNIGVIDEVKSQVLLSTARVLILDKYNKYQQVRALLDCGSQTSFICEKALNRLGLSDEDANLTLYGISSVRSHVNKKCRVNLKSIHSEFKAELMCYVLPTISNVMPGFKISSNALNFPQDLKLADSNFNIPGPIEMLIGADLFWQILSPDKIILGKNLPILQNTEFGWIVSGKLGSCELKKTSCNLSVNQELLQILARFWEIEEVCGTKSLSKDELLCERNFTETTIQQSDGRFIVNMPLKQDPENLGESRSQAEKRFIALERRLSKNENLRIQYMNFLDEYEKLKHMSFISDDNEPKTHRHYYMPHHGVIKELSLTTKLRVVFDASAPTSNGLSLNNIQLVGPVLQDDLLSIILRFRQYTYVMSADIAKMYRQVLINPMQRHLQRILWRNSPNESIKVYELNTVTYGQASSSFLSIRCLLELANKIQSKRPDIARVIKHDFYVDDLLTGTDSLQEAQLICSEVSEVLKEGCFELRKWCSNRPEVLKGIDRSNLTKEGFEFVSDDKTQTLGLTWACQSDKLLYNINTESGARKFTKRMVLSATARIFDPLGLLSPCTIVAKILMQKLWFEKITWDEPLPEHLMTMWANFEGELTMLSQLAINRHVIIENATEIELHGFADSSERAYGACVYLRSITANRSIQVSLLCAKSKVAPLKTISVPRLELCGALLLARLVDKVARSITVKIKNRMLWSDSTITLAWLKTSPNLLKTFTANRVSEIQSLTENCQWGYVPTGENPADIVSRGLYPNQILSCDLWWHGPAWLSSELISWPNESPVIDNLPELKTQTLLVQEDFEHMDFPFTRFSRASTLQRVIAYILRFRHNCLRNENERVRCPLTLSELSRASRVIIRVCQHQTFSAEIKDLLKNKPLQSKNKLLGLTPFLDEHNILRVGGRLKYSNYQFNKKHPMLLHAQHHFTKLIFQEEHVRLLHAGPQLLLSNIRDTYWPISGRSLARSTVRKCIRCFRFQARTVQPIMGNLPPARVLPSSPFSVVGVDYAGPFLIKDRKGRGCKTSKCYIALFICFATKAIHLELVSSLSCESFLQALRRFVSRRGKPSKILSDNGKNFVGAQRELGNLLKSKSLADDIHKFSSLELIDWQFIPPYSPHFGGLWEAGVKSSKHHLNRVLANTPLLFEEFYTLCTQVEAILNSRPLSPISNDPNDLSPLTPSHFTIGKPLIATPDENVTDIPMNRLTRYQLVQQMSQHFWERWKKEYISELQQRSRWKQGRDLLVEGALVLIKDDTKPTQWPLGRIAALHPGLDGTARVATVKTSSGQLIKRGFQKLCPLPLGI